METLATLREWVNKGEGPKIQFLLGGAGIGKSSIAHSIGTYFRDHGHRLGSFFRFDRSIQAQRPLNSVISTISRDLAKWNHDFGRSLANVLRHKGDLDNSNDIAYQWKELILEPLNDKNVRFVGPVLVVIDAFDESGSVDERRLLLKYLTEDYRQLPTAFRILVTSRPEHDVLATLKRPGLVHLDLSQYREKEAVPDIKRYLSYQLGPENPEAEEVLGEADLEKLADKAEGLFEWAATACREVLRDPASSTLKERFDSRLRPMLESEGSHPLDGLYRDILTQLFKDRKSTRLNSSHSGESRMPSSA